MRINLENFTQNIAVFMRSCGYALDRASISRPNELSFVRRLSNQDYPRLHAYAHQENNALIINLHLDQKKPSYGVGHAHNGEYDGELILNECERIKLLHR